jgi:Protein of unknown function (DUF3592)
VISAFVFILAGAFLLGNALAWRLRGERVAGTVIGVRARGKTSYCSVYRYTDAVGRTIEASCNDFSASLAGKQTGLTQQLTVLAGQPQLVRKANSIFLEVGGAAFLIIGFLIAWPKGSTVVTLGLVLGALLGWYAFNRKVGPGARNGASPASAAARDAAPLQRAEDILATSAAAQRAVRTQRRSGPISILSGLAMLAIAVFAGRSIAQLEIAGVRAPGKVLGLVLRSSGRNGSAYHPVVRFATASGTSVQFEDGTGAWPAQYRVGDDVQVLYLANAPSSNAVIDQGVGNWTLPVIFAIAGAALIVLGMRQNSSTRSLELPPLSTSIPAAATSTPGAAELMVQMNVAPSRATDGVTIEPRDPRRARRASWLVMCFLVGWSLWLVSVMMPSAESATGFGPVMLMFAPILGAFLLFCGQSVAVVAVMVRILVRATASAETTPTEAASGGETVGPLARVLDAALTGALVMMAGGCVLIGIGLVGRVLRFFGNIPT